MSTGPEQNPDVPPQNTPPVEPPDQGQRRRRRRWRILIGLGLAVVVLAPVLLLYAQSEQALIHIYLPIASHYLGARVQAEGGSVHLNGRLQLTNFSLAGSDGEPAVRVGQIDIKVRPSTLFGAALPTIDTIMLVDPRLRIRVDRDGNSNLGPAGAANSQSKPEAANKPHPSGSSPQPYPSLQLGRLDVKNLALDYADATGLSLKIGKLDLTASDMVPGKTGSFVLTLAGMMERPDEGVRQEGSLKTSGELTQQPGGASLGWTGSLSLAVNSHPADDPSTQSITMNSNIEGSVTAGGQWNQKFQFEAATPHGPAGHGEGDLVWDDARPLHRASLKIQGIGPDVLNPLLTPLGEIQLVDAKLDADCEVTDNAHGIHFDSSVTTDRVSFRLGQDPAPAGPASFSLIQHGVFDPAKQEVRWDTCDLTLNPDTRQAGGAADRIQMTGSCGVGTPTSATLNIHVATLNADPYMEWLNRLGDHDQSNDKKSTTKTDSQNEKTASKTLTSDKKNQTSGGDLIEADIIIDQAQYRKAALEKIVAKVHQEKGTLDFRVESGKFCGGDLTLHVGDDQTHPAPNYVWDAALNGADVNALMSIQNEPATGAAVETETTQKVEEPSGGISTLLHAIETQAQNVVVDLTDAVGALKPKPKRLTGTATITSKGKGEGSGDDLLRALDSDTSFEIKDGEIQGFFVLDALAIATRIDTFRTLVFSHTAGSIHTGDGKATFNEVGVSGVVQKVDLTGQYNLIDQSYDLEMQPAIGSHYLDKITNNPFLPHMISDSQGYLSFPFEVSVKSDAAGRRTVMVLPKLPQGLAKMGEKVGETVKGAVGGVIDETGKLTKEPRDLIKKSVGGINKSVGNGLGAIGDKLRGK